MSISETSALRIGILGTGHIGKTLARTLAAAGHKVKVANSRGPETIDATVLDTGAVAVEALSAVTNVDILILSVPLTRLPALRSLIQGLPDNVIIADTSNYYPHRDEVNSAIESGQVESVWVTELLGRPVIKAWNAIGSDSFARKGQPEGSEGRIAIPVAGDNNDYLKTVMKLVSDSGFEPFNAGCLKDSWRQQPGAPVYCTDLVYAAMADALAAAERVRLPVRRDIAVSAVQERVGDGKTNPDAEFSVRLNRALFM